ncbi:MAG: hypothetical protein DI573_13985 [Microbacterium sp.]|uniref:hypothetical protein n=1 Tax=Microbacterium sp. TaxID=51671 RepID=UPI000DB36690|nr:hypothetical protein [Microbacterium sp.]PZU36282.1 MAG: hypothetical protein DI573_13985 [Microbacterium sp.]
MSTLTPTFLQPIPIDRHRCAATHRTPATFVKCWMRSPRSVTGAGTYAVVNWCTYRVTLHADLEHAAQQLAQLADGGCGPRCQEIHRLHVIPTGHPTAPEPPHAR